MENLAQVINFIAYLTAIMGLLIILWGVLTIFLDTIKTEYKSMKGRIVRRHRDMLRHSLGAYLLLGLEFFVAADIIRTVVHPTLQEIAILGSIVLIRTVIGYTLDKEMAELHMHHRRRI